MTPNVYDAWGELTYPLDGNDYHLAVTFRNDGAPEAEYTVQTEAEGRYDRAAKLFITHVDSGWTRDKCSISRSTLPTSR